MSSPLLSYQRDFFDSALLSIDNLDPFKVRSGDCKSSPGNFYHLSDLPSHEEHLTEIAKILLPVFQVAEIEPVVRTERKFILAGVGGRADWDDAVDLFDEVEGPGGCFFELEIVGVV